MSKLDRLKSRMKNMRDGTKRSLKNVLNLGENLVVGSGTAYLEGRMSGDDGEWGFRGVPYAYMGGAVLILTGLAVGFAKDSEYSSDLVAAGGGAVGGHLFRTMYESGLEAKRNRTTGGKQVGTRKVPMGLQSRMQQTTGAPRNFGTAFDAVRNQGVGA